MDVSSQSYVYGETCPFYIYGETCINLIVERMVSITAPWPWGSMWPYVSMNNRIAMPSLKVLPLSSNPTTCMPHHATQQQHVRSQSHVIGYRATESAEKDTN